MALDYTMTRDAVNSAVQSDLLNANRIGQSAAQLGYLGADAINQQGGLMQMFNNARYKMNKPKYDAMYQQGVKDNPWLEGDQTDNFWNEVDAMPDTTTSSYDPTNPTSYDPENPLGLSREQIPTYDWEENQWGTKEGDFIEGTPIEEAMHEMDAPVREVSPEPIGDAVGGSIGNVYDDGSYEYVFPDKSIKIFQAGEQPGANQGVTSQMLSQEPVDNSMSMGPIDTALANEQGIGTVSTAPPISASNLQGVDSPGMPGYDQGTEEVGRLKDVMQTNVGIRNRNVPGFENVDQFGMTDEDFKNQGLDMLWNTNASGTQIPDANKQTGSPLMDYLNKGKGLIEKGKGALGLNRDEYGRNYWDKLNNYIFHDQIAPWDPYHKDPYYDLEFDESGRLISDTKYGGLTKEQLNLDYPTYGWTTDARLGRDDSFFSDEIQDFRQGN